MVHDCILDTIAYGCRVWKPHQDVDNTLVDDVTICNVWKPHQDVDNTLVDDVVIDADVHVHWK